jgi:hypothetical protein
MVKNNSNDWKSNKHKYHCIRSHEQRCRLMELLQLGFQGKRVTVSHERDKRTPAGQNGIYKNSHPFNQYDQLLSMSELLQLDSMPIGRVLPFYSDKSHSLEYPLFTYTPGLIEQLYSNISNNVSVSLWRIFDLP